MSNTSLPSETQFSAVADPKTALHNQIERLQNRKCQLEMGSRIPVEKLHEFELFMIKLRTQLESTEFEGAALIYIKCLALIEELERANLDQETVHSAAELASSSNNAMPMSPLPSVIRTAPTKLDTTGIVIAPSTVSVPADRTTTIRQNRFLHFAGKPQKHSSGAARNQVHRRSLWNRITDRGMRKLRDRASGARADEVRDLWNTQIEFFLSCLGFIVGGGNTLRFPAMIFEFGGIFFIPHLFFMVIFGFPLVYMHLAIGQYSGLSASAAFYKMMPIASGLKKK